MKMKSKKMAAYLLLMSLCFAPFRGLGETVQVAAETDIKEKDADVGSPVVSAGGESTSWDCVYFGNYWQEDTNGDGKTDKNDDKTPIKWRVLKVEGDDAFLVADKNLDCQTYNDAWVSVTWENCTMRSWLNGYGAEMNMRGMDYSGNGFLDNAFTALERQAIETTGVVNRDNPTYGTLGGNDTSDVVYLLSLDELTDPAYGFMSSTAYTDTRKAVNTAYTANGGEIKGDMQSEGRTDYWWTRSPGRNSSAAVIVHSDGALSDIYNVNYTMVAVRPALHLNLTALPKSWSNAGTVTAGKPMATPTPAPTSTQTPELTAMPTQTLTQTSTPIPTEKPGSTPTQTPEPTTMPTLTPTQTPIPTPTPTEKPSPTPTQTPFPTAMSTQKPTPAPAAVTPTGSIPDETFPKVAKISRLKGKIKTKGKKKTLFLTWGKVSGAGGYQIQISTKKSFRGAKKISVKKSQRRYKTSKLKKKKTYYVRVRAYLNYKTIKGKSKKAYGKWKKIRI